MVTKTFKVYGADGHRQRVSFFPSSILDLSENGDFRIIEVVCSDITGTNDYVIVKITRNTFEECDKTFFGQYTDGIFENCRVGKIVEVC